ncbi:hypothetical protein TWF730_005089 [Orbilia blumenaviensis]|uniref:Uncharacterized protein n=1 Tax=Orbilia blumenaviensis TaxID=1796055 RepID=A0AAV9VNF0_9PEZI
MGGAALNYLGVATPRMSPETYFKLKTKYHNILTGLYKHVTTPVEAPGKTSYGDLDYLVAEPILKNDANNTTMVKKVKAAFGAEHMTTAPGPTTSFAVPIESDEGGGQTEEGREKIYAQIDVNVRSSVEEMWWVSFKHSYGDFWSILGMMLRAKGLVADSKCLNVRIKEIEPHNRELAKVELTRDVNETLEFLGLDPKKFEKGFETVQEVFEYSAGCRFFEERYFKERRFANARDRSKAGKREMLKGWFEFLGLDISLIANIESDKREGGGMEAEEEAGREEDKVKESGTDTPEEGLTRELVLEEALERFHKRPAYEEKIKAWRRNLRIEAVAKGVTRGLIDGGHYGPKSARARSSKLRKRINDGEMDEIFDMTEEQVEVFIQDRLKEIVGHHHP